jgi:hypothetical protein
MCSLYRYLFFQTKYPGKMLIARNYLKEGLKWTILGIRNRAVGAPPKSLLTQGDAVSQALLPDQFVSKP